jgi:hypothetical protein
MAGSDLNSALGIATGPAKTASPVELSNRAAARYVDGYRVAKSIVRVGTIIKVLGVIAGILVVVAGLIGAANTGGSTSDTLALTSIITGISVWFGSFIAGVVVSALGQQLKANLDSAIHSSPFLDADAKARVMDL